MVCSHVVLVGHIFVLLSLLGYFLYQLGALTLRVIPLATELDFHCVDLFDQGFHLVAVKSQRLRTEI